MKESTKEWLKAIVTGIVVAIVVIQFIMPTMVEGISMEPNLESGDYLLVSKQAYTNDRTPEKGDVIVFVSHQKDADGKYKKLVKRVIAVPGDTVAVEGGKVYINGEEINDDYTKDGITNGEVVPVEVPEGSVFCLGDNRLHSTDSRFLEVGFVREETIEGKAFFRVYPFSKFGKIGRLL